MEELNDLKSQAWDAQEKVATIEQQIVDLQSQLSESQKELSDLKIEIENYNKPKSVTDDSIVSDSTSTTQI